MDKIYFDYAATTPTDPAVIKAMEPYFFDIFGNASSPHSLGQEALRALEDSRLGVAQALGAQASEIVFCSGATEANNHAIFSIAQGYKSKGNHIIISGIEHHSVAEPVEALTNQGYHVTYVCVDGDGKISPEDIKEAISDQTILIAVIHASNEIGTIQPISTIGKIARAHNIPFLVDATQTVGHIPVDVNDLNADLLSCSAHKFYGPKGVGALYIREGIKCKSFLLGGDQEKSRRASTQNIPGCVGMAHALKICLLNMEEESRKQIQLRDALLKEVVKIIEGVKVNGHLTDRLPNNAHFSFEDLEGESLLMSLDMANMCASMGSACTSGAIEPSHVLRAIGLSEKLAYGSLRISLGRWTTQEHIDHFLKQLPQLIAPLRA